VHRETRLLTKEQFGGTFRGTMLEITGKEDAFSPDGVIDLEHYVLSVPAEDLRNHQLLGSDIVEHVYRSGDGRYDQVLYPCHAKNVYLVVVVDLDLSRPFGHILLDLNEEYGLTQPQL
jgi:hypothetical protein